MAYVGLDRGIVDHWIYQDAEYFKVWFEMLYRARYVPEPEKKLIDNILIDMNYGEFVYGRIKWSERLKVSERRLRTLIDKMVVENMIEVVSKHPRFTIYRVVNFAKYRPQNDQQEDLEPQGITDDGDQHNDQRATSRRPADDQRATTKEELNKENNDNKEKLSEDVDESEIMNRSVQIEKHYCKKRKTLDASSNDFQEIKRVVASKIPVEFIIACLDRTFAEYKPKHANDQIRSFTYCSTAIFDSWDKHIKKNNPVEDNVKHFSQNGTRNKSNGWSGKRILPIIADQPPSTPLTPEELEEMRQLAQKLDGGKVGAG